MADKKRNNRIDVVIPAYNAHKSILRTLSSLASQSIIDDLDVTIVNDADPKGDYQEYVKMFSPYMSIREIVMTKNGGPGVARDIGIWAGKNQFFTCIDADDTFADSQSLELLRAGITEQPNIQACFGTFSQIEHHPETKQLMYVPHQNDCVWMFGKLYKRELFERYKIHFTTARANEDTGLNTAVRLLCDNPNEQIKWINEMNFYFWHYKEDSITRINESQYSYDQSFCGWTDSMIYAYKFVKSIRGFSQAADEWGLNCLFNLYFYLIETKGRDNGKFFYDQNWEFTKKYYHEVYSQLKDRVTEKMFTDFYSMAAAGSYGSQKLIGILPHMTVSQFMDKLEEEEYDPNEIFRVWKRMHDERPDLIENDEHCGVVPVGYWKNGINTHMTIDYHEYLTDDQIKEHNLPEITNKIEFNNAPRNITKSCDDHGNDEECMDDHKTETDDCETYVATAEDVIDE